MEKLLRKTGITISLRCLLIVASLVFGSSAWGQKPTTIFSETFDKCDGSGGNDGTWKGINGGPAIDADYTGWTNVIGYGASKCARYGTGSSLGSATTPTLNFTGDATLTFRAGAWNSSNEKTTLNLRISNGKLNGTLSTTTVTLKKGAFSEYTINITGVTAKPTITFEGEAAKSSRFFLDDVVVTQTTPSGGGSKTAATVTFEKEIYSVQTNGEITVSATTNSTSKIVYSISPEDDNVSIDENTGYILAGATAGTYTITATVAENESYTSASADCTLTVKAPSFNIAAPTYYKKITSTDELAVGGTYLIVCEEENCAIGSISSSKGQPTPITYTANNEKGINIISDIAQAAEYLLERNPDGSLSLKNGTSYLKASSGSNTDLANNTTANKNNEKWTFAFNDGNVELVSKVSTSRHLIYRAGTSNVFGNYGKSSTGAEYKTIQLYQKVTDLAISTLTNGYATFVTDVPYAMPKGTCGYAVTVAPQAGVITKTEAYTEGSQVPAQTALLIGGASGTNYYPAVLKENVAATYTGENYMEGRRTAEGYTNTQKGVAVFYYKLALNSEGKPGFYYGKAGGEAFQLTKPTTAYLAVPQSITPVNGYLIDFDGEETGISTIAPTNGNANGAIYNLNGIRMAQTLRNLPKGVYIVNGKKVIK